LSTAEERIEGLKYEYMSHSNRDARVKIIDTLITFGDKGINAIRELIRVTDNDELMLYGLEQIRRSRESP
jgi:hypothetical protein